jgi:hypothetical protein
MPGCPSCGRPVALALPRCLYCGAALGVEQVAAAAAAVRELAHGPAPPPSPARVLLVLELAGATADVLERATGLPAYESRLLARRGGLHLLRALDAGEAGRAAAAIAAAGVPVYEVPEAEARERPLRVTSGERRADSLVLRGEGGAIEVAAADLLLIVGGAIRRELPPRFERRKVDTARLEEGWLVHLHRARARQPLEIDAGNFAPGFALTGSARLEIAAWLSAMAPDVPRDDGFRWLPEALGPAEPDARGPMAAAASLRGSSGARRPERRADSAGEAPALLDNVAQFRFYSGWRGAAERRRRGSQPSPPAC